MKEFSEVRITDLKGRVVLPLGLAHEIALAARIHDPRVQAQKMSVLSIILERDTLTFGVSHETKAEKPLRVDLDDIPAWNKYVLANLDAMDVSVPKITEILNSSFLNAATAQMTPDMKALGQTIGERVNYGIGVHIGDGPHSMESQRIMLKLAHGLIGFCPSVQQRYEDSVKLSGNGNSGLGGFLSRVPSDYGAILRMF